MTRHRETVRRAEQGRANLNQSEWTLKERIFRIFRRQSLSLSELLPRPDYLDHPFSKGPISSPSWYALLVPTHEEGHEVLRVVPPLLANQSADFTVFVAFNSQDPTAGSIWSAASKDARIIPIPTASSEPTELDQALLTALRGCEEQRGHSVTDAMIVPLPILEIKKQQTPYKGGSSRF